MKFGCSFSSVELYAEFGIDLAIDQEGKPWIIEENVKPSKQSDQVLSPFVHQQKHCLIIVCMQRIFNFPRRIYDDFIRLFNYLPQQEVEYVTEIAKHASEFSIERYRFTPFNIHPNTENIEGLRYDLQQKKWIEDSFLLPSFIYDCFLSKRLPSKGSPYCKLA